MKITIKMLLCPLLLLTLTCAEEMPNSPGGKSDISLVISIENTVFNTEVQSLQKSAAISSVVITVTGPDMDTINQNLSGSGKRYSGALEVPKGADRTFTVEANDAADVAKYRGETTRDIESDEEDISITLMPLFYHLGYDDETDEETVYSWNQGDGFFVKFSSPQYPCEIDSIHFFLFDDSAEEGNYRVVVINASGQFIFISDNPLPTRTEEGWVSWNLLWNTPQAATVYDEFWAGFFYEKDNGWPEVGVDLSSSSQQRSYYYSKADNMLYLLDTYSGTNPGHLEVGNLLIRASVNVQGQMVKLAPDTEEGIRNRQGSTAQKVSISHGK